MKVPRLFLFQNGGEKVCHISLRGGRESREMDLLIYLKSYELQKLFKRQMVLAFSWNRRYFALDYLIKVKEMHFIQAVETIMRNVDVSSPTYTFAPKVLLLPTTRTWICGFQSSVLPKVYDEVMTPKIIY